MAHDAESNGAAQREKSFQQLLETLSSDRLIKIFIGSRTTPVLVQESVLRQASEYFRKAIDNAERLGGGKSDEMKFPNDDLETWKILMFWIFNRQLGYGNDEPEILTDEPDYAIHLCRAWIAADMYLMPALQNRIMAQLLETYSKIHARWETAKEVIFSTSPDSGLRRMFAEEVAGLVATRRASELQLQELDGATGLAKSMLDAGRAYEDADFNFQVRADEGRKWLKNYMVKEA